MGTSRKNIEFAEDLEELKFLVTVPKEALDHVIDWIETNLEPEDIFSEKQLSNWAEANGYIKE